MEKLTSVEKPQWPLLCSALVLAACETSWLYGALPGINWAMTTLAVSLGLLICLASAGRKYRLQVVLPLLLACFIAAGAALTADPANDLLIAAAVLFALGSAVVTASNARNLADEPITWVVAAPYALVLTASEARSRFDEALRAARAGPAIPAIRGVALAIPVTLALALLLSEADPTFATARDLAARAFQDLSILPRGLFFLVMSACMVGAFGIALHTAPAESRLPRAAPPREVFGDTERLIVLGSVALLFALFLTLQVSYLFGNPGGRAGSGVSYADAVHRGFTELNVASTVCGALLFGLRRYAVSKSTSRWLKPLEWIVTLQAQILLVSAFYRVDLYEAAYGFTKLRLYVQVYAVVGFIALILLLIELGGQPRIDRFLRRVMVVAALALGGLIWGNSEAWIAHANILRYSRTGQIDVPYLTKHLGPDAVPELVGAIPQLPGTLVTRMESCLRNRYPDHPNDERVRWFEWSLRRAALNRALAEIHSKAVTGLEAPSC
jgi:hypothetical protein